MKHWWIKLSKARRVSNFKNKSSKGNYQQRSCSPVGTATRVCEQIESLVCAISAPEVRFIDKSLHDLKVKSWNSADEKKHLVHPVDEESFNPELDQLYVLKIPFSCDSTQIIGSEDVLDKSNSRFSYFSEVWYVLKHTAVLSQRDVSENHTIKRKKLFSTKQGTSYSYCLSRTYSNILRKKYSTRMK